MPSSCSSAPWSPIARATALSIAHRRIGRPPSSTSPGRRERPPGASSSATSPSPAFLQPPVPEGRLEGFRTLVDSPDELDVLITSKNHDVKIDRIDRPSVEHWIFALLTLQTMQGFLGRGNYGIARMNGGFASRPGVASAPGLRHAERFRRDVAVWLDARPGLVESYGYTAAGGHALLWLLPWDGRSSRSLQECDPFFLEICRRVRLHQQVDGTILASARPSDAAALAAKELHGDTGDVWTPVRVEANGTAALTVGPHGFSYSLMTDLLLPSDYRRKVALTFREEDGKEPLVVAQVLVRGQGKTDGYRERIVPIPAPVRRRLSSAAGADEPRRHGAETDRPSEHRSEDGPPPGDLRSAPGRGRRSRLPRQADRAVARRLRRCGRPRLLRRPLVRASISPGRSASRRGTVGSSLSPGSSRGRHVGRPGPPRPAPACPRSGRADLRGAARKHLPIADPASLAATEDAS